MGKSGFTFSTFTIFQQLMELGLQGLYGYILLVYLNINMVETTWFQHHFKRLKKVLDNLQVFALIKNPNNGSTLGNHTTRPTLLHLLLYII